MKSAALGSWGEHVVCTLLQRAGWQCVARNRHTRFGELDLVMVHTQSATLGVFEVKTSELKRTIPLYGNVQKLHRARAWRYIAPTITVPFAELQFFTAWIWMKPQVGVRIVREDPATNS